MSQPDNMAQKAHYTDCKNANNPDSSADRVMGPLTRLFTYLMKQLKLLTTAGHDSHGGTPIYERKGRNGQQQMSFHNGHRWHTNNSYHKGEEPYQDCHIDCHLKASFRHNGHQWGSRDGTGNKSTFSRRHHTRIHEIESGSKCDSECLVMSDLEEHLVEEGAPVPASPKKLSCPSQDMVCAPEILRGSAFCEEVIRHSLVIYIPLI